MPTPRRTPPRGLPEGVRRKLEVATAMAWEALVETHVAEATAFVALLAGRMPLEESLTRYLREMDLSDTMATAIRTRVLLALEGDDSGQAAASAPVPLSPDGEEGWRRFMPDAVVRGVKERQRRTDEAERLIGLALARSEEAQIRTHVENAIGFGALLENHVPLDRAVQQYLGAVVLTGCRGQVVFQRTMARLAEVHLPV
jgi:exonuclease VII small subunit